MTKYDVYAAIIRTMAKTALNEWNWEVVGSMTFPAISYVEIRFISSVNPPRYQSKFIIWTLAEAFDFYNEQRRYSNSFITTKIEIGSRVYNLGVASIKSSMPLGSGLQKNSSVVRSTDESSLELTSNDSATDVST